METCMQHHVSYSYYNSKTSLHTSYSEIGMSSENINFEPATVTTMTTTGTQPPSNASWFPDVRVFPVAPRKDFSGLRDHGMGGVLGTQAVQGSSQQSTLVIKGAKSAKAQSI